MAGLWVFSAIALLVAAAALAHSRRVARQLAELTHLYWSLKFEHGELKAKVNPPAPAAAVVPQGFVPLSAIKKS